MSLEKKFWNHAFKILKFGFSFLYFDVSVAILFLTVKKTVNTSFPFL